MRPDTDGDGLPDDCESIRPGPPARGQTNLFLPDSDADGLLDGEEDHGDCEWATIVPLALTNPRKADTDGDGILDGIEVLILGTDPLDPNDPPDATDSSGDGLPDSYAIALGLDPTDPDWDGDGYSNAYELLMGSDPLDPHCTPSLGDVNGDGVVDNLDATILFRYIVFGEVPAVLHLDRADIRADGVINNQDSILLNNWLIGRGRKSPLPIR